MLKDKNTLLGILLIVITTALFFFYVSNKPQTPLAQEGSKTKVDTVEAQSSKIETATTLTATAVDTVNKAIGWNKLSTGSEQLISIENDVMKVFLSNKGGRISKVELKKYTAYNNTPVVLFDAKNSKFGYQLDQINTNDLYFESKGSSAIIKDKDITSVSFQIQSEGKSLIQTYSFKGNSYLIDYKLDQVGLVTKDKPNLNLIWNEELKKQESDEKRERMYSSIYYLDPNEKDIQYLSLGKNEEKAVSLGFKWMSFKQQFFNTTFIASKGFGKAKIESFFLNDDSTYVKKYKTSLEVNAEGASMQFFTGPNSYNLLKELNFGGEKLIPLSPDFVLMRWTKIFNEYFIIPLFNFLSHFFSNYGIIILILTLIIKMLLLPLSYKTFKLGVATKVLKPELDEIKKKYGDDQQKFAQEQMKVMSQAGVSQLSGCLPALLQVPLLIAMVNFFPASIELRHESFLWAHDLSTFDNIWTLPFTIPIYGNHVSLFTLLMTITQVAMTWYMQKNQPSNAMADQMKYMTYFMPVMLMFMFNSWPAAMTYYYLLQNAISMAQQYIVTKYFISEDQIRAEIDAHKKTPKKKGIFQQKMDEMMAQAEEAKKLQQKAAKK